MRIAVATCAALPGGFADDHALVALLGAEYCVWTDPEVDWQSYDRVLIRSTWDYALRRDEFVAWARSVGPERLLNSPRLIEWNSDKTYLADLDLPTVPTHLVRPGDVMPELVGEVVVKPTVSAGGVDTGRFGPATHDEARALVRSINDSGRTAMVQPYLSGVDTSGETALVFLGGSPSHVLHKKPVLRPDEVAPLSEAEGGLVAAVAMFDPELVTPGSASEEQVELAHLVVEDIVSRFGVPAYVRVDLVPGPDGKPVVLEIEAVEPCLYLDTSPGAAERLAAVVASGAFRSGTWDGRP